MGYVMSSCTPDDINYEMHGCQYQEHQQRRRSVAQLRRRQRRRHSQEISNDDDDYYDSDGDNDNGDDEANDNDNDNISLQSDDYNEFSDNHTPTLTAHHALRLHNINGFSGIKCPVCNRFVLPDDIECHLVMCLTKPRLSYNEDVLTDAKGECVICLEDLNPGDVIARLPCLCIYHKGCIEKWFEVNRSCPEHPGD